MRKAILTQVFLKDAMGRSHSSDIPTSRRIDGCDFNSGCVCDCLGVNSNFELGFNFLV